LVEETKRDYIQQCRKEIQHDSLASRSHNGSQNNARNEKAIKAKHEGLERLARVWSPFDKLLSLAGVRVRDLSTGTVKVVREPGEKTSVLRDAWSRVFGKTATLDERAASEYWQAWGKQFDFSACRMPDIELIKRFLRFAKHAAPGPDGLPYVAWKSAGEAGARTLFLVFIALTEGSPAPLDFNDSISLFIPKGEEELDHIEILRHSEDTRPLGLKNSVNKILAGVANWSCKPALSKSTVYTQRGFVPDRQLIENVVNLDTAARISSAKGNTQFDSPMNPRLCPILALWDIASAFPSVSHEWLMLVLDLIGAPCGLRNLVRALYRACRAFAVMNGDIRFLYFVQSGVLQGCPLSGMLFAIIFDPFLRHLEAVIDARRQGTSRACADDVGASLNSLSSLLEIKPCFDAAERLGGLGLKPAKCVIIPTVAILTDELAAKVKEWLNRFLPGWADFRIKATSKYLGFQVGPASGSSQWNAAIQKYKDRAVAIAHSHAPAGITVGMYNSRAVTVLGYLPQISLPPFELGLVERAAASHALHFATNATDEQTLFGIGYVSKIALRSLKAQSLAALSRAAHVTIKSWPKDYESLTSPANDDLMLESTPSGRLWPLHWDSPAAAFLLKWAAAGFPSSMVGALNLPGKHFIARNLKAIQRAQRLAKAEINAHPKRAIQKIFYFHYFKALYQNMPAELFERRFREVFAALLNPLPVIDWRPAYHVLAKLTTHEALVVVKTWSNSWTTSARFHDNKLDSCLFGCFPEGSDALGHYLCCPRLWKIIASAKAGLEAASLVIASLDDDFDDSLGDATPLDPLERLCVRSPSIANARTLVLAYTVYNTLKHEHFNLVACAPVYDDFSVLHRLAIDIARAAIIRSPL
jgi:hypothetical protein